MRSRAEPISLGSWEQGESPRVDPRTGELLWVDMRTGRFFVGDVTEGVLRKSFTARLPRIGCVAPLSGADDGWVAAGGGSVWHVATDGSIQEILAGITTDTPTHHRPLNDGTTSPDGALWVGSQCGPRDPEGALYRVAPDLSVSTVLTGVTVSNGIGFTADGNGLHYIDTLPHRRLEYFDVDGGRLSGRRTVAVLAGGNPDGLVVDEEGCAWVSMWDAGEVRRLAPTGEVIGVVEVPVPRPTACTIRDGVLFITTASVGLDPAPEHSGRIFAADVGVSAPQSCTFRWEPPRETTLVESRLGKRHDEHHQVG